MWTVGGFVARSVSKSLCKMRATDFFREVEKTGMEIILTDGGKPSPKLLPYNKKLETW